MRGASRRILLVLGLSVSMGLLFDAQAAVTNQAEQAGTSLERTLEHEAQAVAAIGQPRAQPTFGLDRVEFLRVEVAGYPLWQYLALLLWIALAFVVASIIDFLMTHQLRRLAARTETDLDERLLEILHTPVKVVVTLLMLNLGIRTFAWPEWLGAILSGLFVIGVAGTIVYVAIRLVDLLLDYVHQRFYAGDTELGKLLMPVLGKTLKVFVVIIGTLTTAQYLGLPITSVLAGLGIGGVAVALAAQNTLANVIGTIMILTDRPFRVGDRVQVDKYDGSVESINLRSSRLRTLEGHLVTIPNKIMADSAITNVSMRPNIRQLMTVSLTYDTPAARMQEAVDMLRGVFQRHPLTHDAWVYWKDYGPSSLDIFVAYWCKSTDFKVFLQAMEEINLQIKQRFDVAGLDFAFPTQTIQLQQVPGIAPPNRTQSRP
ncbi:MAG TPA: mechanosensitive ion channel family protein [Verrucomicrobiae bacterium]|nr:mechanosensitive ion channel family protein [Verrucomicrobiae bacterium]